MITTIPPQLNLLDVIALKTDLPQHNLLAGQVGTIVEILAPEVYEVEFSDDDGQTYAMLPLHRQQLLRLQYQSAASTADQTIGITLPPKIHSPYFIASAKD
jgi:hypothetical protein